MSAKSAKSAKQTSMQSAAKVRFPPFEATCRNACAATLLASADNKCRFSETASDGFKVNLQLGSFRHWFVIGSGVAQERWFPNE
jgi:hypothetical protein